MFSVARWQADQYHRSIKELKKGERSLPSSEKRAKFRKASAACQVQKKRAQHAKFDGAHTHGAEGSCGSGGVGAVVKRSQQCRWR